MAGLGDGEKGGAVGDGGNDCVDKFVREGEEEEHCVV